MNKGLLTLLLLFTCFAHAQVVDTWQFANPQQQQQALNIASQLRCPQCQNQNLLESNAPVAVSMRHHGGGGEERSRNHWLDDRTLRRFCSL